MPLIHPLTPLLWTTEQAAQALGISPSTLSHWRAAGPDYPQPPFVRLGRAGRTVRYRPADLEAWLDQQAAA